MRCNKVDDLLEQQKVKVEQEKREIENLKLSCANMCKSNEGINFLKYIFKMCFWSEQDLNINNEILIYKKGRRDTWAILRNVIPKEILTKIEIYDEM